MKVQCFPTRFFHVMNEHKGVNKNFRFTSEPTQPSNKLFAEHKLDTQGIVSILTRKLDSHFSLFPSDELFFAIFVNCMNSILWGKQGDGSESDRRRKKRKKRKSKN